MEFRRPWGLYLLVWATLAPTQIVDTTNVSPRLDTTKVSGSVDSTHAPASMDSTDLSRILDTTDASRMADSAGITQNADSVKTSLDSSAACREQVLRLRAAYADRDPRLFSFNPFRSDCGPAEAYETLYYQGFGQLHLGRADDALLYFALALEIGGPWDAQLLFETMRLQAKFGKTPREDSAFFALENKHPESPFLFRARSFRDARWRRESGGMIWGGLTHALGDLPNEGPNARLFGEWSLGSRRGGLAWAGRLGIFGKASLDSRSDHEFAAEAGADFNLGKLALSLDGGPSFSASPESLGAYSPAEGKWEWQISGRLTRDFHPMSRILLQGNADFLVLGSAYRAGGGGWRGEFKSRAHPFLSLRAEGSRTDPVDCVPDSTTSCERSELIGGNLEAGAAWKPGRQSWTVSGMWRQDKDAATWEKAREFQSVAIRYAWVFSGAWSLLARLEGGRKDLGEGWEPLLRSSVDCVFGW